MSRASRNMLAGALTAGAGLLLWRYAGEVDVPVVTPAKAGVVLMCAGAAETLLGVFRALTGAAGRPRRAGPADDAGGTGGAARPG
ncbi:hypothetical protein C1708_10450 [Streptomyces sp. DH-12]|uniref:DUF5708 family protein n=1 Tax=unclassified Streptomyces TaxID=2593676 RepID=UPI000CCF9227|nr:DUF5708 family protein [Streptomyces sp. DH-12]PNV32682.1 hypothetical protein C1708_10450 [Streptomyces sp. DH-12]